MFICYDGATMKTQKWLRYILTVFAVLVLSSVVSAEKKKAEILYDNLGIPHIYAQSDEDAVFAFGFAQAKDRMFMMDALRRVATGRMCEILGSFALIIDRKYIAYDFEGTARKQWAVMAPESKKLLQTFADGVNYAIEKGEYSKFLYEKLGVKPEPFTSLDTLVIANFTGFMLEESVSRKMMMLDLISQVGKKEAEAILGIKFPESFEKIMLSQSEEDSEFAKSLFADKTFPWIPKWGSNNWVVGKSKSGEGAAIMNNDPHVPFEQPCLFYEAHIKTPSSEIYGVTIPGVPAIAVGFTPYISFGATVTWADMQDVVLMQWSADKKQVYDGKKWVDVVTEERVRKMKGDAKIRKLTVQRTPYGPVLKTKGDYAVVMRWSFDESPDDFVGAYKKLLTAKNVTEARAALRGFTNYSLNMVVADTEGNIGYQFTGKIPVRKGEFGFVPYFAGETEWMGFVPQEKLPGWENPKEGYIYTANHNFFQKAGFPVSGYFDPGYRAKRIEKLLNKKKPLDKKAMEEMMSDDYSLLSEDFLPVMLKLLEKSTVEKDHVGILELKAWDRHCNVESKGCAWFHVWVQTLFDKVFKDALGSVYPDFLTARYYAVQRLLAYLKGEIKSEKLPQDRVKVAADSFLETEEKLMKAGNGQVPEWGKLHQIVFSNPFDLLGFGLSVGPFPVPGALFGVGRAEWDLNKPFTASFGAPFRITAVMEKPVRAYTVLAPGQNENPNDAHGKDQVESWLKGGLMPVLLDKDAVLKSGGEKINLEIQ